MLMITDNIENHLKTQVKKNKSDLKSTIPYFLIYGDGRQLIQLKTHISFLMCSTNHTHCTIPYFDW